MRPTTPQTLLPVVWAVPGSLAATAGITRLFSFPAGTKMFQFPALASGGYEFTTRYPLLDGLPHSEIPGSKLAWQLPEACRSLPRPSSLLDA